MSQNIEQIIAQLNERQTEAVNITEGPLLVVAGAGSGKTKMLTVRIAHLVENRQVDPSTILAVTFTNKAAREMRERVRDMIYNADEVTLTTFHSFCCLLMRRWSVHAGFAEGFTIYDESDSEKLIKQVIKSSGVDSSRYSPRSVLSAISQAKNELIKPDHYLEFAGAGPGAATIHKLYHAYQKMLEQNQAADFDDLIFKTYYMLVEDPELLERLQNRYRYFLVDEYQDTNHAQYKLISLISAKTRNLCVVGDEDQSIYSWRGATIRNIRDFEKDFHGATVVLLEQNYRSTQIILDAATAVIRNNKSAHPKKLWTDKKEGEPVSFFRARDDRTEAEMVVKRILALRQRGYNLTDFAVLFRMNSLSRQVEQALKRNRIEYDMTGGTKFFDRREVKDILAYLKVINNPHDSISLERIIAVPRRGIGAGTLSKITSDNQIPLWEAIAGEGTSSPDSRVGKFFRLILEFMEAAEEMRVSDLCRKIISEIKYEDFLRKNDPETAEDRVNNVQSLVSDIRYQEVDNPELKLADYLANTALHAAIDNIDESADRVHLLTMHNAKGLEFPVVFIMAMEEGIFPHHSSKEAPEELEEERRLAYVGMTRAQERLILSASTSRMMYGNWGRNPVSRFVPEVPAHLFEGYKEKSTPTQTRSTLSKGGVSYGKPTFNMRASSAEQHKNSPENDDCTGTEAGTMLNLKPGVKVMHSVFGHGMVEKTLGTSLADFRVSIRFDKPGRKTLLLQYATLRVIK